MKPDLAHLLPYISAAVTGLLIWLYSLRRLAEAREDRDTQVSYYKKNASQLHEQLQQTKLSRLPTGPVLDHVAQEKLAQFEHLTLSYSQLHHAYTALRSETVDKAEASAMQQTLAQKERELSTLTARHASTVREVESLRKKQSEENHTLSEAHSLIHNLREQMEEAKAHFAEQVTHHTRQQNETHAALQEEVFHLRAELATQHHPTEDELHHLQDHHENLVAELRADLESALTERDEARAELAATQEALISPEDHARLDQHLKALSEEHGRLMDDFTAAEDSLRHHMSRAEEHALLVEDVKDLRAERDELISTVEEAQQQQQQLEEQLHTAETQLTLSLEEATLLRNQLQQKERHLIEIQAEQETLLTDRHTVSALFTALEQDLTALRSSSQQREEQLSEESLALRQQLEQSLGRKDLLELSLHSLQQDQSNTTQRYHRALKDREERSASELAQIRLALVSSQAAADAATDHMEDQVKDIFAELTHLRDTLHTAHTQAAHMRCSLLSAEERLALAESVSLRSQAEAEQLRTELADTTTALTALRQAAEVEPAPLLFTQDEMNLTSRVSGDLAAASVTAAAMQQQQQHRQAIRTAPNHADHLTPEDAIPQSQPQRSAVGRRLIGAHQSSAIVFVYETDSIHGPVYSKSVLMSPDLENTDHPAASYDLVGADDSSQLLQIPRQPPKAEETVTSTALNSALLRALHHAESQVARRAESRRLYHRAYYQFTRARSTLPTAESQVAADVAMALSRVLQEDQDSNSSLEAARTAANWARQGYGERTAPVADAQRWLAQLLLQEGKVDDGIAAYRQTLSIREHTLGHQHPDTQATRIALETLRPQLVGS